MDLKNNIFFSISLLEKKIGYKFKNVKLLRRALCHSSYANDYKKIKKMKSNEILEFLGDSILNFVITVYLTKKYPKFKEGKLSKIRSKIISKYNLFIIAKSINLGKYLFLGRGEIKTNGENKSSILANTLEALIGSIYLDSDIFFASIVIKNFFIKNFRFSEFDEKIFIDYKSNLQEITQAIYNKRPFYKIVNEYGYDHNKFFKIMLSVNGIKTFGSGSNKKIAEQAAAHKAILLLKKLRLSKET